MGDQRVWNRTRGQWLRSVVVVGVFVGGASAGLFVLVGALWNGTLDHIGAYIGGLHSANLASAGLAGAGMGLAAAVAWGWIGRPRLVAANGGRTGGDTTGARFWPGSDGPAGDGDPDPDQVTS